MAQTPVSHPLPDDLAGRLGSSSFWRELPGLAYDGLKANLLPSHEDHPLPAPKVTETPLQRIRHLAPTFAIAFAALLLAGAMALFVFRSMYSDRIYPAVVVGDVNVGGLTATQAQARLTERAAQLEQGTVSFSYNGKTWVPTLTDLGVSIDLSDSIAQAQQLGRGGDAASRLGFTTDLLQSDQVVPLESQINMSVLNAWFDKVDRDINNPAINAQIVLDKSSVSISPDSTGIIVDRKAATQQIMTALATLNPVTTDLPTLVDQPKITVGDLEQVQADVQEAIAKPVRIGFEDKAWRIEGDTLSTYLTVETVLEKGKPVARLSMDRERLAADLRSQFAPEVNREPKNATVEWSSARHGIIASEPSQTGLTLKAGTFADALADSYLGDHRNVTIPVIVTRPTIDSDNLDALGIKDVLGEGDSNFAGGAWGRDENIYVATSLLNGTLVAPGEEFSFNGAIGEITYDKGYQDAGVVVAEEIGRDVGGGVCQVSTTVFRAALLAGMPITEWHPHTYRLSNYERDGWGPGFDASILQMGSDPQYWADFRFENYTGHWLLIQSYTTGPNLIVDIFGTSDGREVDLSWWGITGGKDTGFTRTIKDKNGNEIAVRDFASDFK